MVKLRAALEEAETFVAKMPTEKAGLLFLKDGHVVQPDTGRLDYQTDSGQRRGQWPGSAEISAAHVRAVQETDGVASLMAAGRRRGTIS
jgi:hypothetical protein